MPVAIKGTGGGSVTLSAAAAATDTTLTLPNTTGTVIYSDASGYLQFNSGYGSVATAYGCRAWVNFNGTGTVAIRASGNVSSITDNGVGNYTVNFTTAMSDANYSIAGLCENDGTGFGALTISNATAPTTSAAVLRTLNNTAFFDSARVMVNINR
jgi:hypothetical protein